MPEIQYVALPSFTKFVQMEVLGSNMASRYGGLGSNHRNTLKNIQESSSEPLGLDA